MSSDFLNLLDRLVKAGVDFVIVGGFAGVVHGRLDKNEKGDEPPAR